MGIAKTLLSDPETKVKGKEKLAKLLDEKIDLNKFLVWFVENYPVSFNSIKADPALKYHLG